MESIWPAQLPKPAHMSGDVRMVEAGDGTHGLVDTRHHKWIIGRQPSTNRKFVTWIVDVTAVEFDPGKRPLPRL